MTRDCLAIASALVTEESGQDLLEYALVAALISIAAIAALKVLATNLAAYFTSIGTRMAGAS